MGLPRPSRLGVRMLEWDEVRHALNIHVNGILTD